MSLDKTAILTWDGALSFDGLSASGHTIRMDGQGNVTGPSPMEVILIALAGCAGMDVISILRKKRQVIDGLVINARGRQSNEHPQVFTHIELNYLVRGRKVDPAAVDRAIFLSQTKYCPVSAMISKSAEIHCTFHIEESETESTPA